MRSCDLRARLGERRGKIAARSLPIKLAAWALGLLAVQPPGAVAATMDDARALLQAGRLEEAVAAFRAVAAAPASPEEAGAARNNACVVLMDLGDYRGALDECLEARRLREAGADRRVFARTLNNTALALQRLGRHAEAEAAYEGMNDSFAAEAKLRGLPIVWISTKG